MKYYVIHYTGGVRRKEELLKRAPWLKDATWITKWDREDIFCDFVKHVTKSPLCPNYMSLQLKHFETLYDMVINNVEEAMIFEDDVVFQENWEEKFNAVPIPDDINYVKLGCLHEKKHDGTLQTIYNNGGIEATYVKLPFAKEYLNEIAFIHTVDILQWGFFLQRNIPLYMIPVCGQLSFITGDSSSTKQTEPLPPWREVIQYYTKIPKYKYTDLLEQYEDFKCKKQKVEELFEKTYNQKVDIKRIDYVYNNELT